MFDHHLRSRVEPKLAPVGHNLRRTGLTADHLTAFGILMAAAAAVAIGAGALRLGVLFGVLCAVPDVLDGAVAKASGTASRRGSFFDSVADRLSDALIFGGVTWYLSTTHTGPIVVLPLAVLGLSMLISYERAKAESLGFQARGGVMERAERLIVLAIGAAVRGAVDPDPVDHAGAHRVHRDPAVRPRVAAGQRRGAAPPAPGAGPAPEPPHPPGVAPHRPNRPATLPGAVGHQPPAVDGRARHEAPAGRQRLTAR